MVFVDLEGYIAILLFTHPMRVPQGGGKLCFVITQTVFKTVGGGEGFRRFRLGKTGVAFKVLQVDDMAELQPFDSATNRTAVFCCRKGDETEYPVEYHIWRKKGKGGIPIDLGWADVQRRIFTRHLKAQSVDGSLQGSWITAKPKALGALKNVVGKAEYQGRIGSHTGGANGVYWVRLTGKRTTNGVEIENLSDIGKNKYRGVTAMVERDLVYPLVRGRDTRRWHCNPNIAILLPHETDQPSKAFEEGALKRSYPATYCYFEQFRAELYARSHYKAHFAAQGAPYYSIYNVGPYTLAPYKVVWSEIGHSVEAVVVGSHKSDLLGVKVVVPDHTVVAISFDKRDEADFVCAMLNSSPSRFIVVGYVVLHPSPHILKNIRIPKYSATNETHRTLARLSGQCHEKVTAGIDVSDLEEQIDETAAEIWGLSKEELRGIKESLDEMQ